MRVLDFDYVLKQTSKLVTRVRHRRTLPRHFMHKCLIGRALREAEENSVLAYQNTIDFDRNGFCNMVKAGDEN